MNFINEEEDDLQNKTIKINDAPNASLPSISNNPTQQSNAVSNFINGFKNFLKPKINSTDIEKDNLDQNSKEFDSIANKNTIESSNEKQEESCKDKLANKIIDSVEVERNIGVFVALVSLGSVIICISFFLLPLVLTSPKKFSFCFAVGCIFVLISFLFLVGTRKYVTKLLDNKRIFISIMFILSIFVGIAYSLGNHYFISLICSGIQLISLIMFILIFIPGGRAGIDCIKRTLASPFTKLFVSQAKSELNNL